MFELKNITKKFGTEYALRGISAEIGRGLNFLVGASGSGKTTLLRILSGMENDFEGTVFFGERDLKTITPGEKSRLYNETFGFVWQDFNLLDDRTVLENILLPRYLKTELGEKQAMVVLRNLKMENLAYHKVRTLSGGQKQRVAIARELMKEPKVIFADEPTSALDKKTSGEIMEILRNLSKRCTVIVVTHDTSLIQKGDNVYELDKGELISVPQKFAGKIAGQIPKEKQKLAPKRAISLAKTALHRRIKRTAGSVLSLFVAAALLLIPVSGAVTDSGQAVFDELFASYGSSLLDINISDSFISASGTGGDNDSPNVDVEQNIDGLFERYLGDERVEHVLFAQPFGNIVIQADGEEYAVENTNNMPVFNFLEAGELPVGDGMETVVPESFVEMMGLTNEEAIGKEIEFSGTVFNWESGAPVETPMSCTVTIVGVADTTMITDFNGEFYEYTMGDSFFFSPKALAQMRESAQMSSQPGNFYIRCKTPADVISVKDELSAEGIVPLGRFELIEDMVRLNQQTAKQTGTAMWVIAGLSLVVILAVAMITAVLRRKEFAVLKVSGFAPVHLVEIAAGEAFIQAFGAAILFLATSPLLNMGTKALWSLNLLTPKNLAAGALLCLVLSVLFFGATAVVAVGIKAQNCLRTGDR